VEGREYWGKHVLKETFALALLWVLTYDQSIVRRSFEDVGSTTSLNRGPTVDPLPWFDEAVVVDPFMARVSHRFQFNNRG